MEWTCDFYYIEKETITRAILEVLQLIEESILIIRL